MSELMNTDVLQGFRVLVIDDEPDAARIAEVMLRRYKADVRVAVNGQHGLKLAREQKPDFILSDISMPEMSGYQLAAALKQDPTLAAIPLIALTAHAMPGNREKALAAGFDEYLTKPLRPRTFIDELLTFLRRFPQLASRLPSSS